MTISNSLPVFLNGDFQFKYRRSAVHSSDRGIYIYASITTVDRAHYMPRSRLWTALIICLDHDCGPRSLYASITAVDRYAPITTVDRAASIFELKFTIQRSRCALYYLTEFFNQYCLKVGETGASSASGHVRHVASFSM